MEPLKDNSAPKKIRALQTALADGTPTQAEYQRKTRRLRLEVQAATDMTEKEAADKGNAADG